MDTFVVKALGAYEVVSNYAHLHGYSQLERVRVGEVFYWVKRHRYPGKQAGEIHALRFWGPGLGRTPELVAWSVDPAVVILREIEGVAPELNDLELWREGGEWLSRMHALENDWLGAPDTEGAPQSAPEKDSVASFAVAVETRLRDGRDHGWLDEREIAFVSEQMNIRAPSLAGDTPRAVHRDFGPRNWIARPGGGLAGVIDFEHAVWGNRCMDLGRLSIYSLDARPDLREAFFAGYGPVSAELEAQIEAGRLLHAVGGLVFAHRVGDVPFQEMNRLALWRMMGR
ncbi:aminoglycoside phosphotransferase family protein [bacterium]|nr:MAG: aminoglycoside phosphotransferase family protein [bacterium]